MRNQYLFTYYEKTREEPEKIFIIIFKFSEPKRKICVKDHAVAEILHDTLWRTEPREFLSWRQLSKWNLHLLLEYVS